MDKPGIRKEIIDQLTKADGWVLARVIRSKFPTEVSPGDINEAFSDLVSDGVATRRLNQDGRYMWRTTGSLEMEDLVRKENDRLAEHACRMMGAHGVGAVTVPGGGVYIKTRCVGDLVSFLDKVAPKYGTSKGC